MAESEPIAYLASTTTDGTAARPKVLRRPAQFSGSRLPALREQPAPAPQAAPPVPRVGRAWQDDVRFGLALIISLIVLNVLMILLVPHLPHRKDMLTEKENSGALFGNAAMPQPVSGGTPSDVTVYAEPHADESGRQFDLNQVDPAQNDLSVSPKDTPAPTARPLATDDQ